ncbi:DUF4422 domain-containing protein [Vibrio fluvialis]|nr:DUF4422 domain-containing protein [Vibrio fluvialis]
MAIYVASHKVIKYSLGNPYVNFLLGENESRDIDNHVFENNGDNIAYKNSRYCELTGYYWLWKNCKDKYIGLVHYRRHFQSKYRNYNLNLKSILSNREIEEILKEYDIILPKRRELSRNIKDEYAHNHFIDDWNLARKVILSMYPSYDSSFNRVEERKYCYDFNMLITSNELFSSYCEWLFPVLFEIEEKIDYSKYDNYQSRVIGFLAERILNIWVEHHSNLKIKEVKVVHTELTKFESIRFLFKDELKRLLGSYA